MPKSSKPITRGSRTKGAKAASTSGRSKIRIHDGHHHSKREEALKRLGVDNEEIKGFPNISERVIQGCGSIEAALMALRGDDSEDAQAVIQKYDSVSDSDRKRLRFDDFVVASGLSPRRLFEVLTGALMQQSADISKMMVSVSQPKVIEATIFAATDRKPIYNPVTGELMTYTNGDVKAQELFHKATGFLPTPKGSNTTINLQQLNQTAQLPAGADDGDDEELPSMDEYLLELQDVVRPALPAPPSSIIPANAPELEYVDCDV